MIYDLVDILIRKFNEYSDTPEPGVRGMGATIPVFQASVPGGESWHLFCTTTATKVYNCYGQGVQPQRWQRSICATSVFNKCGNDVVAVEHCFRLN